MLEAVHHISGLPIKYTEAPRFVFLNEGREKKMKAEEEEADEYEDLYKAL